MIGKKLVKSSRSGSDGRSILLELTASGRKLFQAADASIRSILRARLTRLNESEIDTLLSLFNKLETEERK